MLIIKILEQKRQPVLIIEPVPIIKIPEYKRIYVSAYPLKNTVMNKRTYYVYSIAMLHRVSKGI